MSEINRDIPQSNSSVENVFHTMKQQEMQRQDPLIEKEAHNIVQVITNPNFINFSDRQPVQISEPTLQEEVRTDRQPLTKERVEKMVEEWMQYVETELLPEYFNRYSGNTKMAIKKGVATEESVANAREVLSPLFRQEAVRDQTAFFEISQKRLLTLAALMKQRPRDLKDTTVVSIGGGPGDKLCEPWFPRVASITGANVINFDYSPPHPVDQKQGIYTHIGGTNGNILNLLLNDKTIYEHLRPEQNISIIECNNLIGNNPSPDLMISLGTLTDAPNNPTVVQMRQNLREAASVLLTEGGVLAIDNAYWVKKEGKLLPVKENGEKRTEPVYSEEKIETDES